MLRMAFLPLARMPFLAVEGEHVRCGLSMKPFGWFQIGWSYEVPDGGVVPKRYFSQDLVVFRSLDGELRVLDAYCRHLGANLAYGGTVVEMGIRCPFHGWVWNAEGRNESIPYQDRPNKARRVRAWPVQERNGVIYLWHDEQGRDPLWTVPDVIADFAAPMRPGVDWYEVTQESRQLFPGTNVHPQYVIENAVDPEHFRSVHSTSRAPMVLSHADDDWTWRSQIGFGSRWADGTSRPGDYRGTLNLLFSGLGLGFNALIDRDDSQLILIATTPVDEDTTDLFGTYWMERQASDLTDTAALTRRLDAAKQSLVDDVRIWDHQQYADPPALATSEGAGFRSLRRWTERFYPASQPAEAVQRVG